MDEDAPPWIVSLRRLQCEPEELKGILMRVPCPGCDRGYDADRFVHGRSFHCACGARVGQRLETGTRADDEPRFMVDSMLGGLARWLRVLGYDAAYDPQIADAELIRRGIEERRIILTRDRRIPEEWWLDTLALVESEIPLEQLGEVAATFNLSSSGIFTRCTRCNEPLRRVAPEDGADRLPPAVRERGTPAAECPGCMRIYWEGSHTARMRMQVEQALG
jgi:uncharacterized protein with PIN domain